MQIDTSIIIAVAALFVSTLGPFFTGFFALRQTKMQNEHSLKLGELEAKHTLEQAEINYKMQRRQEEKMYYIQILNTIIDTKERFDVEKSRDHYAVEAFKSKFHAYVRSIPDEEIQKSLAADSDTDALYNNVVRRLGIMIHELLMA